VSSLLFDDVPGSEKYVHAKNGRLMLKCKCVECGITKTKFVKSQTGGNSPGIGMAIDVIQ